MFTSRKWWLLAAAAALFLSALPTRAQTTDGLLTNKFIAAGRGTSINLLSTGIGYHLITWHPVGTVSACTVALDSSANGTTWSAGGVIVGQDCTTDGQAVVTNDVVNYVSMNVTALTHTAGSYVNVTWTGWVTDPAAGGSGTVSCNIAGAIAFETAANTLGCDGNLLWDNTTKYLIAGPPKSSFNAFSQLSLDTNADGLYSFRALDDTLRGETVAAIAQFDPSTGTLQSAGSFLTVLTNAAPLVAVGEREGAVIGINVNGANLTGGYIAAGLGVSSQISSNASVSSIRSIDIDINNNGTGTVTNGYGVYSTMGNHSTGTVTTSADFFAADDVNDGGGTVGTQYGFLADAQTAGSTASIAFGALDQGNGANNYAFFSAGGKNKFARGATSTSSVIDILDAGATDGPFGLLSVRGTGVTNSSGFNSLAEFRVTSGSSAVMDMTNASAPAGSNLEFFALNDGSIQISNFDGGTGAVTIGFNEDSALSAVPNVLGISFASTGGLDVDGFTKSKTFLTATNCADSAGAAACGSAAAGSFVVDAASTSTVVSTTAVTANSEIFVQYDSSLGTRLSVTCNVTAAIPSVTARTAGTNFTVTIPAAPTTNPACYSYHIVN